jgi:hypothetical protein
MRGHRQWLPGAARHREKFLPEEDVKLKELVQKYGTVSWDIIAREMPGRNPRQCRERWKHYVSSTRPKSDWSPAEDVLLYQKMEEMGPRWTNLAQFFPGRTDLQVKSRWMQRFALVSDLHLKRSGSPEQTNVAYQAQPYGLPPPPHDPRAGMPDVPVQVVHVIHWSMPPRLS